MPSLEPNPFVTVSGLSVSIALELLSPLLLVPPIQDDSTVLLFAFSGLFGITLVVLCLCVCFPRKKKKATQVASGEVEMTNSLDLEEIGTEIVFGGKRIQDVSTATTI